MTTSLIGPDGRKYVVDNPADVAGAVAAGYRIVTPSAPVTLGESAKGLGNEALDVGKATAEGVAGGFTAGLSDLLSGPASGALPASADPSGDVVASQRAAAGQDARRLRDEHPLAHGVGEFVGMMASPVNKVGAAVRGGIGATTALGRIGAAAVGSGAEGILYGAGNTMSEAALGNTDLTAEKLIAGAGLGGLLGLAGGGLGASLEEGFKAVVPAAGRLISKAKGPLEDFADDRWLKAGGAIKTQIKNIPEAERPAVANELREAMTIEGKTLPGSLDDAATTIATKRDAVARQLMQEIGVGDAGGLLPAMDRDAAAAALNKGFETNGKRIGAVYDATDALGTQPQFSPILKRFDALETSLNPAERDIIGGDIAKARKYLYEMGNAPVGSRKNSFRAMNDLKSTLQGDINWAADSGAKNQLKKKLVGIIRDDLDSQMEAQLGQKMTTGAASNLGLSGPGAATDLFREFLDAKAAYGALKNAAKAVKGKNATGADAIGALVKDAELTAPSLAGKLSALDHATAIIKNGLDSRLGNRFVSLSDYMTGLTAGAMTGHPLGALSGIATAVGHKILREQGPAVIAKLTDAITSSPRLMMTAASFGQQLQGAAPALGKYAAPLLQAYAHSPASGLATHMAWAKMDPDYADAAQSAGFLPETPEESAHATDKATHLAAMAHTLDQQNQQISKGLDSVFKGTLSVPTNRALESQDFGTKRMRRDSRDAHKQRVTEIRALMANPDALLERVAANLGTTSEMAPGVAAAATRTAHAAVAYLAQSSQEPPKAGPLAMDWIAPDAEVHEFSQVLDVVERPLGVLRHAAAGTLVPRQWEAVQTVYPLLAAQIRDSALERLADPPKDVPYRARLMLGMITGIDVDGTLSPAAVSANQNAIAAAAAKGEPGALGGGTKDKGFKLGDRMATPGQKREMSNEA